MVTNFIRRKLRLKDEHIDALKNGCPDIKPDLDITSHVKACDACTRTILGSGELFSTYTIARIADWERIIAVAEPGTAALRFTTIRPCDRCGAEIYGTRQLGQRGVFWANRLDNKLHSCDDFRGIPEVVELWSRRRKKPRGSIGRSKKWSR